MSDDAYSFSIATFFAEIHDRKLPNSIARYTPAPAFHVRQCSTGWVLAKDPTIPTCTDPRESDQRPATLYKQTAVSKLTIFYMESTAPPNSTPASSRALLPRIDLALMRQTDLYAYMSSIRPGRNLSNRPRVLRIQSEIRGMFADHMDLLSLTRWRQTCKINYAETTSSLRRSLIKLLNPFVPTPQTLLKIMSEHCGVFGGELALSFLLRDPSYLPADLEIFVSHFDFDGLCDAVADDLEISEKLVRRTYINNTVLVSLRRLVSSTLRLHMAGGHTIFIHRSYTLSPCAPLTRAPCTALSNYVTPYGFGCSHPALTLARRALLADQDLPNLTAFDHSILDRLLKLKFSMAVSPAAWPEYRRPSYLEDVDDPEVPHAEFAEDGELLNPGEEHVVAKECWQHRYICPSQGRYFGNRGSFVDFFDPLGGDKVHCVENNVAPFGPMAVWRVTSTFDCEEGCEYFDEVLEEGVASVPVIFKKDPYGELYDLLSDRCMGNISQARKPAVEVSRPRSRSF